MIVIEYWDEVYTGVVQPSEWYGDWTELRSLLFPYLRSIEWRILEVRVFALCLLLMIYINLLLV